MGLPSFCSSMGAPSFSRAKNRSAPQGSLGLGIGVERTADHVARRRTADFDFRMPPPRIHFGWRRPRSSPRWWRGKVKPFVNCLQKIDGRRVVTQADDGSLRGFVPARSAFGGPEGQDCQAMRGLWTQRESLLDLGGIAESLARGGTRRGGSRHCSPRRPQGSGRRRHDRRRGRMGAFATGPFFHDAQGGAGADIDGSEARRVAPEPRLLAAPSPMAGNHGTPFHRSAHP